MIASGGAWLSILGGVFTDRFIVQKLTDMMWIGLSTMHEDRRVYRVARVLLALGNSVRELQKFYNRTMVPGRVPEFNLHVPHPRNFPYPNSFVDHDNQLVKFKYMACLENDSRCVTYVAQIEGSNTQERIVVKFVDRYGAEVHRFLADRNYAPRLRYYGPLPQETIYDIPPEGNTAAVQSHNTYTGGLGPSVAAPMMMVVMDYVQPHPEPVPDEAGRQITSVLDRLHENGYVFGDLRRPNVLFDSDSQVKLIDLDWAGRYDVANLPSDQRAQIMARRAKMDGGENHVVNAGSFACYPLSLSNAINWGSTAGPLLPIPPQHDREMLESYILDLSATPFLYS